MAGWPDPPLDLGETGNQVLKKEGTQRERELKETLKRLKRLRFVCLITVDGLATGSVSQSVSQKGDVVALDRNSDRGREKASEPPALVTAFILCLTRLVCNLGWD